MINITSQILNFAGNLNKANPNGPHLAPFETGGGCDYMWCRVGEIITVDGEQSFPMEMALGSQADIGSSPETLATPSRLAVYFTDPEWQNPVTIDFDTASDALEFMSSVSSVHCPAGILAKQMVELECGSEKQIKAETQFFTYMKFFLSAKKFEKLVEFSHGATTEEMADEGLRLISFY